jgi:hypothetical protein
VLCFERDTLCNEIVSLHYYGAKTYRLTAKRLLLRLFAVHPQHFRQDHRSYGKIESSVVSCDISRMFPCSIILNCMITDVMGAFRSLFAVMHAEAFIE